MLVESIPTRIFTLMFGPTVKLMLGLAVLSVIVCFVLGSIVSHGFTKPIYALIRRMNQNRFPTPQEGGPIAGNEIAILNERYDDVFNRLEMAIADYHEEQQKKKEAQIRALEFQINPHFLYNTLSTIVWLIDAGEAERAIEITQKLSEFFRVSISKGRDFISIREEIRHVQLYLDIQKARYEGQIFVRFLVPESLLDLNTPKLILQPLVENSIIHAMQKNHDQDVSYRNIWLRGRRQRGSCRGGRRGNGHGGDDPGDERLFAGPQQRPGEGKLRDRHLQCPRPHRHVLRNGVRPALSARVRTHHRLGCV